MLALPIDPLLDEITAKVRDSGALVLEAAPGAGKTTRVPRALLQVLKASESVLVAEPRRLSARLAAQQVASDMGEPLGETVGYAVRFESASGPKTRVHYVTEGVLLRRLLDDPLLRGVGAVVLDEFHERHLQADLLLALLTRLARGPRRDLRLVVMSATLDTEAVARFLGCPRVSSTGRLHPLTIEHLDRPDDRPLERQIASAVRRVLEEEREGDVLVFLPGAAEIRRAKESLDEPARQRDVAVLPLHGDLPLAEQARAVERGNRRKVILSTNVAESSITVEGVTAVIDSGLARIVAHSPWSGLPELHIAKISRASATQRAGRAGRLQKGRVLRLYTRGDFDARPEQDRPEILRLDLTEAVLSLHGAGITNVREVEWLDAPSEAAVLAAETLLRKLHALGSDGQLTSLGRRMLELPLPPRLARLVVEGERRGVAKEAALAAAVLSERDIRRGARSHFGQERAFAEGATGPSDVLELMERFEEARDARFDAERLRYLELDRRAVLALAETSRRLSRTARNERELAPEEDRETELLRSILAAYPDRVARRRTPGERAVILSSGTSAELSEGSVVRHAPYFVALDAEERGGRSRSIRVRLASAVKPDWLLEDYPELVAWTEELAYNSASETVETVSRIAIGSVILDEDRKRATPSQEAAALLARAARASGFDKDPSLMTFLRRLELASEYFPELSFPQVETDGIQAALAAACDGKVSLSEVRGTDLGEALSRSLEPRLTGVLRAELPERLDLPGGRAVTVNYESGKPPWIASRLQDFFGMTSSPSLCRGRLPVTVHLLAPNQRAVQVTQDLEGFWERHYPTLRRELGRRYPRHPWPEDGRTATPPKRR